jgi:O-antigen ligase
MTWLARAGWLLSAAFFATILSSIRHVDHVGGTAELLLLLVVVIAAIRPDIGLVVVVLATPVAWYLASAVWSETVEWAETVVCAVLIGVSLNASFRLTPFAEASAVRKAEATGAKATGFERGARRVRIPLSVSAPAVLFGGLVIASLVASLGIKALRLGPGFTDALVIQLTRQYFVDLRGFPGLHAGMLLLEGVLLFAAGARIAANRAGDARFLHRMAAAAAASATLAAAFNIARPVGAAWHHEFFWASLRDLADNFRWNEHYSDFNAAGSYFVMAALLAAGLTVSARGRRRIVWILSAVTIATALWLTSSRAAMLAGFVAAGVALFIEEVSGGRRARALRGAGIAAAGIILVALVAVALPQRGTQKSWFLAGDVRLGLIQTGVRMMANRPVFGIGLGEFYQRSGEFSSPDLIAKFPVVALHENAHNNFIQVAAELGVAGGILFAWLMVAPLIAIGRRAAATREPFLLLTLAAVGAFVLTCLGGHPLLVREPGYVFWTMLGVGTGSAALPDAPRSRVRWLVPVGLIALALTMPWRLRETTQDAELEHVGIGVSAWQTSPDGAVRYREAPGHASLFVPQGAIRWSVYPLADQPLRLELKLDGRVADVVTLAPRRWNELTLPARTTLSGARYARLDLRLVDNDEIAMWITKVQPIR